MVEDKLATMCAFTNTPHIRIKLKPGRVPANQSNRTTRIDLKSLGRCSIVSCKNVNFIASSARWITKEVMEREYRCYVQSFKTMLDAQ